MNNRRHLNIGMAKVGHALWMLGLMLVLTATLRAAPVNAVAYSVTGSAEIAGPGTTSYAPLKKGQVVAVGSTIRTGDDGIVVLVTTPGSAVQLGNNSILKITELAFGKSASGVTQRDATLQLNSGVISALIDHDKPKVTNFKIQTPQGAAAARGTFYAVLVYNGKTYVGVKEGKVVATSGQ